ncbi:polyphosphate kinase 2 family protein [Pannus brasiliensis CCIBt3594]|uniref:Polyphosphate kinase 2 family protein n=1 Tax=Pannus brasiliensis CCIBt3594 TaxID=1427578 RepID=A0AAW9QME9_9CHRO
MEIKIDRQEFIKSLIVPPGKQISLRKDYDPGFKPDYISKEDAKTLLQNGIEKLAEFQDKLYAQDTYALLVNLQAMDAAGKDGTIKHVMSGLNPQGCQVFSFKIPSAEELDHDYLWRYYKALPERGRIGIFNRSYYEELLVVRVHPELLDRQKLPPDAKGKKIWKRRFEEINNLEKSLVNNGVIVLKIFLYVSREEQKKRFLERIDRPEKNWKFSENDVKERRFWDDYMNAYEDIFNNTSTEHAPWYIVPADRKWFTRLAVGVVIYHTLESLGLQYPAVTEEHRQALLKAREVLENEG